MTKVIYCCIYGLAKKRKNSGDKILPVFRTFSVAPSVTLENTRIIFNVGCCKAEYKKTTTNESEGFQCL
jgi:hypothetical protein